MEKDPSRAEKQSENQSTGWESLENMEFQGDIIKEARAYDERLAALKEAIRNSDLDDDEKGSRLHAMEYTKRRVLNHVDYACSRAPDAWRYPREARRFDEARTLAHDKMIDQLNYLNEMAEASGTPRFTKKDYITKRELGKNPTQAEKERASSDRREVEEYFDEVFSEEIEKEEEFISMNGYKCPGYYYGE